MNSAGLPCNEQRILHPGRHVPVLKVIQLGEKRVRRRCGSFQPAQRIGMPRKGHEGKIAEILLHLDQAGNQQEHREARGRAIGRVKNRYAPASEFIGNPDGAAGISDTHRDAGARLLGQSGDMARNQLRHRLGIIAHLDLRRIQRKFAPKPLPGKRAAP